MRTIDQWLAKQASFQPDKVAILVEDDDDTLTSPSHYSLTYAELNTRVNQVAYLLQNDWQLRNGDRIAWLGLNHPDMFVLLFAAAKLGLIVIPLNWRLSVDELLHIIEDSEPQLIFHDIDHQSVASQLNQSGARSLICIALDNFICANSDNNEESTTSHLSLSARLNGTSTISDTAVADTPVTVDTPFLLVYTSGTTGRPKGAVLPHRVMSCNAQMSQHMYDLVASDRVLNVLPLFHVGGINIQPLPALMYGATLVLHRRFNPEKTIRTLQDQKITLINTVPTLLQAILDTDGWANADLTHLRSISIGSTDVPIQLINAVHRKKIPLVQVYGATETGPIAIYQRAESSVDTAGCIGQAGLLCDVKLTNSKGDVVSHGDPGEICIRGDNILSHYWKNKQATDESLKDGWFCSGDVARMDDQGNFWFSDRLKHVIISGGENIYPAEIERVIREIHGVSAVSVVGISDERWGEIPAALIVTDGSTLEESDVINFCRSKLAKFKTPRIIRFANELPRNAMGKVIIEDVRHLFSNTSIG